MTKSAPRRAGPGSASAKPIRLAQATADRRQRLLDAGLELFAVRGFSGVSIRDIANRAGVNVALLYHYFGDKRSLYDAILADAVETEVGPQLALLAGAGSARERVHTFVVNLLDSIIREDPRWTLIERMFMDSVDGVSTAITPMRARFEPQTKAIIEELAPGGGEIPWPVISGIINGLPHAILRSHRVYYPERRQPTSEERARLAAMLTEIMISAFEIAAREAADHAGKSLK